MNTNEQPRPATPTEPPPPPDAQAPPDEKKRPPPAPPKGSKGRRIRPRDSSPDGMIVIDKAHGGHGNPRPRAVHGLALSLLVH